MKNSVSIFHALDGPESLRDPHIPPDVKTQDQCNVSRRGFYETALGPLEHEK
jgi:hypothetical protein